MNNKQGVCCNALVFASDNKILVLKRSNDDVALPGNWELPGGGIEYKETAEDSLKREVKEECNLDVQIIAPLSVNNFYIDETQYFEITYLCKLNNNNDVIVSKEHSEYKWVSTDNLSEIELSEYMQTVITSSLQSLKRTSLKRTI